MKTIRNLLSIAIVILLPIFSTSAAPILTPVWISPAQFNQPESVVYDANKKMLYLSNINGDGTAHDGNGYISQLGLDGTIINQTWVTGLDAPKGMAIVGDKLYVADINQLVVIDINTAKIAKRYPAPDAIFLNDVAADNKGYIYVSDMMTDTIHRLAKGEFEIWIQDPALEAPNGLLVESDQLIVGSWGNLTEGFATDVPGHLKIIDINSKEIKSLGNKMPVGNLDGVEADGRGNYLVTDWVDGKLLHITPDGMSTTLLILEQGSADHTVLLEKGLLIIPMMLTNNVIAYEIKQPEK